MAKIAFKKRGLGSYGDPAARHAVMPLCGRLVQTLACLQSTPASDAEDKREKGDFRAPIPHFLRSFMPFFLHYYIAEHLYFRNLPICQIYPSRVFKGKRDPFHQYVGSQM